MRNVLALCMMAGSITKVLLEREPCLTWNITKQFVCIVFVCWMYSTLLIKDHSKCRECCWLKIKSSKRSRPPESVPGQFEIWTSSQLVVSQRTEFIVGTLVSACVCVYNYSLSTCEWAFMRTGPGKSKQQNWQCFCFFPSAYPHWNWAWRINLAVFLLQLYSWKVLFELNVPIVWLFEYDVCQ